MPNDQSLGSQQSICAWIYYQENKKKPIQKKDSNKTLLVERIQLKPTKELSKLCHECKNLYNVGNYYVNMNYDVMEKYLNYNDLAWMLKSNRHYKAIPAHVAQNVLRQLHLAWKSYFAGLEDWRKNPHKYEERPGPPNYLKKDGEFIACFNHQVIPGKKFLDKDRQKRMLHFPKKTNLDPIEIVTPMESLQQVRIVPKNDVYNLEIVYNHVEPQDFGFDKERIMGIDLGVTNLACCVNNVGLQPFVINGRPLKSINQYYNKKRGKWQSEVSKRLLEVNKQKFFGKIYTKKGKLTEKFIKFNENQAKKQLFSTKRMKKLQRIRHNKITDYMHKSSRFILNYCMEHDIGVIVIGKNDGWKQGLKKKKQLNRKVRQEFTFIPFNMLIEKLRYKADLVGIEVKETTEEYTSQTCCKCGIVNKKNRKYRGLRICSNCKTEINADVNGAYNILKKVFPNALNVDGIEGTKLYPIRIDLNSRTRLDGIKHS